MALTDHCDIFASFHEDGLNRIVGHVQRQRPSLFNYATQRVAKNPKLLCRVVRAHPIVATRSNPLVTIVDPLPVPGTPYGVDFAAQVTKLEVDFHPGNVVNLPPELQPPLGQQRLALRVEVCAGIGCPPDELIDSLVPPPAEERPQRPEGPLIPLPARRLTCFCLDAFAVGGIRIEEYDGRPWLEPFLEGFEIVDIRPEGLENALECYIGLLLRLSVLPGLRFLLEAMPLEIVKDLLSVVLTPTPTSPQVPNNPALEDDRVKAFIELEVV